MTSRNRSHLITSVIIAACVFGAWKVAQLVSSSSASDARVEHLLNQVWIDHFPADSRDAIGHLVLFDDNRHRIGVTGRSSQWRHQIELFKWRLKGKRLAVFFPQERMRERVEVRTWRCAGEAPAPFELCLRIENRRGDAVVLYSREDWAINAQSSESVADDLEKLADTEPALSDVVRGLQTQQLDARARSLTAEVEVELDPEADVEPELESTGEPQRDARDNSSARAPMRGPLGLK